MTEERDARQKVVDQLEEEYAKLVAYELSAKTWAELEAIEFNDRLLFPDVLHVRRKSSEFEMVKVAMRVPRAPELRKARAEAKLLAASAGINPEADRDIFGDLECSVILQMALRSPTDPFEPFCSDVSELENRFDRDVLKLAWSKLEGYRRVVDPRPAAITREQIIGVTAAIAKKRDITPLAVFDSPAQNSYIIFTASLLQRSGMLESLLPSSESSMPAP